MKDDPILLELFAKAEITLPSALRLEFICLASSSLTPVGVVFLTRSEPAKSTSTNLLFNFEGCP